MSGDLFADTAVGEAFRRHTADPEAFDAYIEKMRVLGIEDQNTSDTQMWSIQAKTMVIVEDADALNPEHLATWPAGLLAGLLVVDLATSPATPSTSKPLRPPRLSPTTIMNCRCNTNGNEERIGCDVLC